MYFNEIHLEDRHDRLTREGMADVMVSRVVNHKFVQAWADWGGLIDLYNPVKHNHLN
jgi:hypothetical protein